MKERWERFCRKAGIKAYGWWELIEKCYEGRAYHNLDHIEHCLNEMQLVIIDDPLELECAIWFHDLIYTVGGQENERKSAAIASALVGGTTPNQLDAERIYYYIMATTHTFETSSFTAQAMCDIDLAGILGIALVFGSVSYLAYLVILALQKYIGG